MKGLEAAWNAGLGGSGGGSGGGAAAGAPEAYKNGYSVDILSNRELMELRRNIESTLDNRGVAPQSSVTYDWRTDAGEAGIVTARMSYERPAPSRPSSASAGGRSKAERPQWMSGQDAPSVSLHGHTMISGRGLSAARCDSALFAVAR